MKVKYKNIAVLLSTIALLLIGASPLYSQDVVLRFMDAKTGKAIQIDQLTIFKDLADEPIINYTKKNFNKGQALYLPRTDGKYELFITAKGYQKMEDRFILKASDGIQSKQFMLSPEIIDENVSFEKMASMKRPDGAYILGYLTDVNGLPLSKVKISNELGAKAVSDVSGYYELFVPYTKKEFYDVEIHSITYEKEGYLESIKEQIIIYPNGVTRMNFQLERGKGKDFEITNNFIVEDGEIIGKEQSMAGEDPAPLDVEDLNFLTFGGQRSAPCYPNVNITIGYNCNCGSSCPCSNTTTRVLEDYTAEAIDNEWLTGWSNLSGIGESYRAASVAIRTFAAFRFYNPRSSSYHIAACTCDQVWSSSEPVWATAARDATIGRVLKVNGAFLKAEYSSENNNRGGSLPSCLGGSSSGNICGNGNIRDGIGNVCVSDPLGTGYVQYGHGRNMCQFCSARWATGLAIGFWCNNPYNGSPHNQGTKTWSQMISHYYPSHTFVNCNGGNSGCTANITRNGNIANGLHEASNSVTSNGTVLNGRNITFRAGNEINLNANFEVKLGATFSGEIGACSNARSAFSGMGLDWENETEMISNEIHLKAAPNPFTESTNLSYRLSAPQLVYLEIRNELGQLIKVLHNGILQEAGDYNISISTSFLPKGVYYCFLNAENQRESIKLLVL